MQLATSPTIAKHLHMVCATCGESEAKVTRGFCKPCRRAYDRAWYHKNRESYRAKRNGQRKALRYALYDKLREYCKTRPCADCGEDDYIVLEFDHIDRATKKDSISNMVTNQSSWKKIQEELKKCRVLCCNCHRRRTAKQFDWYKNKQEESSITQ